MNDAPRVLIVGVGSIGERHLRCFRAAGADVTLCEPNAAIRERVASEHGIARSFPSLDAAMDDAPLAAVVATPAQTHVSIARQLVDRGIHVLVEKPLSTRVDGIDELTRAVAARGVVAAVAYVMRANPGLAAMRDAIVGGRFGKVVQITATCGQSYPTFRPNYRELYYARRASGGGAIQDALTHVLNAGEWLAGPIDRLVADAARQVLDGVEVEDTAHLLTRQGGAMGAYALNQYQQPNETSVTVACERGTARWEPFANRWRWCDEPNGPWHDEPHEPLDRDGPFVRQARGFLATIAGEALPLCTLDEGIQTLKVNLAALDSADHGGWREVGRASS